MSGGSYDYLFINSELDDLYQKRRQLQEMVDRLAGLDPVEFPGSQAAAGEALGLLASLNAWALHARFTMDRLSAVMKAVEWWDSADSGPDGVVVELGAYLHPPIPGEGLIPKQSPSLTCHWSTGTGEYWRGCKSPAQDEKRPWRWCSACGSHGPVCGNRHCIRCAGRT